MQVCIDGCQCLQCPETPTSPWVVSTEVNVSDGTTTLLFLKKQDDNRLHNPAAFGQLQLSALQGALHLESGVA